MSYWNNEQPPSEDNSQGGSNAQNDPYNQGGYTEQQGDHQQQGSYQQDAYQQQGAYHQQGGGYQQQGRQRWQPSDPRIGRYDRSDTLTLGPMTLADILDNAFRIIKRNWQAFGFIIVAFSAVPVLLSATINAATYGDLGASGRTGVGLIFGLDRDTSLVLQLASYAVILLTYLFVLPLVTAALSRIVASTYLGQKLSAGEAFRGVGKLWPSLVGASILAGIAITGGIVACVLPGIALAVLFAATTPIIAIEEGTATSSIGRSWALMKLRFWPYLGTLIITYLVTSFVAGVLGGIPELIGAALSSVWSPLGWPFFVVGGLLSNVLRLSIFAVVATLIYLDARVRFEGFDLQMAAANRAPQQPPQTPGALGGAPSGPYGQGPSDRPPYQGGPSQQPPSSSPQPPHNEPPAGWQQPRDWPHDTPPGNS